MNRRRAGQRLVLGMGAICNGEAFGAGPRRVGVLAPSTAALEAVTLKPFFDEMHGLGWLEGRNVVYDRVFADEQMDDLSRLAASLVARAPELIYAPPQPAAVAARRATSTIPIVFATATDPIGAGLVASLARPAGNATRIGQLSELAPKSLELLRAPAAVASRRAWWRPVRTRASRSHWFRIGVAAGRSRDELDGRAGTQPAEPVVRPAATRRTRGSR